jgi:hypothetical protein
MDEAEQVDVGGGRCWMMRMRMGLGCGGCRIVQEGVRRVLLPRSLRVSRVTVREQVTPTVYPRISALAVLAFAWT